MIIKIISFFILLCAFGFPIEVNGFDVVLIQKPLSTWKYPGGGLAALESPVDIAGNSKGNIFVVEWVNHRIIKLSASGSIIKKWGYISGFINIDPAGQIVTSCMGKNLLQIFSPDGKLVDDWSPTIKVGNQISNPNKI